MTPQTQSTQSPQSPQSRQVALIPLRWWHLPAVLEMEQELFGEEAWSAELFWSELANPHAYYLLACSPETEEPLAYGGLAVTGADGYIQTIGVHSSAQRHGIGRRLMHAFLAEAAARGATTCWLEVRADNAPAQRLYESLGFTNRGVRRGYYQPSGMDAIVMSGPIPARDAQ
jgi:ribosomal-protein-alanine N-acetyltransferase